MNASAPPPFPSSPYVPYVQDMPASTRREGKDCVRPALCADARQEGPLTPSIATSSLPAVAICSPALWAVSGVSTHAAILLKSRLIRRFRLLHFQLGSEGRSEAPGARAIRTLLTPWRLLRFLHAERPAILHLNTSMALRPILRDGVLAMLARAHGVRVVMQIHGGQMPQQLCRSRSQSRAPTAVLAGAQERAADRFALPPGGWVMQRLLQTILALNDAVVVLSMQEQAAYRQFCPGLQVLRIPNGIDLDTDDCRDAARGQDETTGEDAISCPAYKATKTALRLLYLGRLIPEKGLYEALDAVAVLVKAGRKLHFTIAGAGPAAQALAQRVRVLKLEAVVRFTGPVAGGAKAGLWRQTDVMLLPSFSEGLPYALLEAMASGTPAVTCAVGAIPDVMQDGVHGLLVPPHDSAAIASAIARLDDERALLAAMAIAGRRRVREAFSAERLAADFSALYGDIIHARI